MMTKLMGIFRGIASSILEIDDTTVPYEQLEILNDFLSKYHFNLNPGDMNRLLSELKRKHLVDSITVMNNDGELVVSSEGNGNMDVLSASSLLKHIDTDLASPESVLIKGSNGWFMLFPFNERTYVVKAQSSLSNIELKALAAELESFVPKIKKSSR